MATKIITPPAIEPVTLVEAKAHLRVDSTDDDALISSLIVAARQYTEILTNRALITQTWDLFLEDWPDDDYIVIPYPPLQTVTSVTYRGTDGTQYTVGPEDYIVDTDSEPGRVVLSYNESWPSTTLYPSNPIAVRFSCGYGDAASDVPQAIRHAILLLIGHWYVNREAVSIGAVSRQIEFAVDALLAPYRVWGCSY